MSGRIESQVPMKRFSPEERGSPWIVVTRRCFTNGRLLLIFIGYLQAGLSPKRPYLFDIDMVSLVYDVAICSFVTLSFVF
ncbi:hypothetical protein AXFE_16690 [Acidithrix ferrooxidans]|uniref:Uncharacterized protein n=1 Tax=Acidithrix ferrooxidans TaxID=1280514 RepID=A0A0D8HHZ6_9ACTN|nr:hypothetical protein AXFE_16690 [Acidithrix ferrooxidans]